jgi:two-component system chemotaxis response regulator CheY
MGKKILIADDSASMRKMIAFTLSEAGHTIIESVDGQDALAKLTADVNAVITDLNMPNMNGIDLIKNIRAGKVNRFVPIIMLTTESEAIKKVQGRNAGATAWIVKPFTPPNLLETITKVVG